MRKTSLHSLTLAAGMLALAGLAPQPALAQPAGWKPRVESIVVRAGAMKDWHNALTASHLGKAFMVSASIPVPYSDLNLTAAPDATELGRRVRVAAVLICEQLDRKYPPNLYPIVEGYSGQDCAREAVRESMVEVDNIVAHAKR